MSTPSTIEQDMTIEDELLSEFAQVMHEWNFAPFRRGEVALPTREEAFAAVVASPYFDCWPGKAAIRESYTPLTR